MHEPEGARERRDDSTSHESTEQLELPSVLSVVKALRRPAFVTCGWAFALAAAVAAMTVG